MHYYRQENSHWGEPQKYLSLVKILPWDQPKLPTNHKMQIHRKPQVHLGLGLPRFQKTLNSKASTGNLPAHWRYLFLLQLLFHLLRKLTVCRTKPKRLHEKGSIANAPECCHGESSIILPSDSQQVARQHASNTILILFIYFYICSLIMFFIYQCLAWQSGVWFVERMGTHSCNRGQTAGVRASAMLNSLKKKKSQVWWISILESQMSQQLLKEFLQPLCRRGTALLHTSISLSWTARELAAKYLHTVTTNTEKNWWGC